MLTDKQKQKIVDALKPKEANYKSGIKFSTAIGLNPAQWSRIKNGDFEGVLSTEKWIRLARENDVELTDRAPWKVARTPVYEYLTAQLESCQNDSISMLLCDIADIGKTFTAKTYAKMHANAVYIDCSQVKTKQALIREISKQFGLSPNGHYQDVYRDLITYVKAVIKPVVILDEAGDLQRDAFLELKALWNALENHCGWAMMGADGLKEKIRRAINFKKVGFTELFSRYGSRYQKITPDSAQDRKRFLEAQAAMIIKANTPEGKEVDVNKVLRNSDASLRRIHVELSKLAM
ncbi:MAG: ATP-binding protein [Bacteroidales bacterium]|nr:ATP-binding protein [Bacteroidales bacterium]